METFFWSVFSARVTAKNTLGIFLFNQHESTGGTFFIPGNQEGLFKLAIQLRFFFYSAIYNTATRYVLWVYLTDI
jgi:hypothetical protein